VSIANQDPAAAVAADCIRQVVARHTLNQHELTRPSVGIILGSGLGSAADCLVQSGGLCIPYSELHGMPCPHVTGHAGKLVLGEIHGLSVAMLQGRVHSYEGHSLGDILFGIRVLRQLGIQTLVVTNAAGGICHTFTPGSLMLIRSHIRPPGSCFPDFSSRTSFLGDSDTPARNEKLWLCKLRTLAKSLATSLTICDGVYAMMPGPCYETAAEIRMLQLMGADAVGMSTIPEAIYAASWGIEVLGVSCITNVAAGLSTNLLSHAEVTATASSIETEFQQWLWNLLQRLAEDRATHSSLTTGDSYDLGGSR
jgi:purine-nucleoside phosphorylase